jgi:mandelate racemase
VGTPLLTIRGVRSTPVNVPMARPLKTSAQTINLAPLLLIDLETDEGVTGRSYLFCYTKMAPALIATVLSDALEVVHGDRVAPVDISAKLAEHYRLIGAQGVVRAWRVRFEPLCA